PSFRESCTRAEHGVQRAAHDAHSAVKIEFHGVLSRIRLYGGEEDGVAAVAEIARVKGAEPHHERGVGNGAGALAPANENGRGNRERVLTGHAQNAYAACPDGR